MTKIPLSVLWDDLHLIAVDKPAGLLSQGTSGGEPTLEDAVRLHLRPDDPDSVYLGTVHRLDRPVSGVIIWAKTSKAARRMAEAFAGRNVKKTYWAVVEGMAVAPGSVWEDRIGPVGVDGRAALGIGGKPARARVEPIGRAEVGPGLAAIAIQPETGRTHQLRIQSSSRGRPITGDTVYGATRSFPTGIALHSRALSLQHPMSGRRLTIEASPPPAWTASGFDFTKVVLEDFKRS